MGFLGLHHIQLAMPREGERQAIAFYEGILGIPRIRKPADLAVRGGCWFETDLIRIHLGIEEDFRAARKAHPALLIQDLQEWRRRLLDAGVPVIDDKPLPGFERFYAYDPFGNRLEFLAAVP
ncbi:MAG TPA: VOC family protein [Acidimicrobiia bacterium]|nr:VOC family protein [Acidimicrobiia bacterium]